MEFGVLGPVEVWVDGRPARAGHARQRAVLAVLLLDAGRAVPLEVLIDRVWGEDPPRSVRNVVYGYVGRLKTLIAAAQDPEVTLSRRSGGYQLHAGLDRVDVCRFRNLIAGAATAAGDDERAGALLGEALELWRGTALSGLDSPWLNGQRARLELEWAAAAGDLRDIRIRHGEHAALVGELTAQVADSPADERLIGQLMLTLYRSGRQAEALNRFEQTRKYLAGELGTDPGPELRALHAQILRADPVLNLPPTVTDPAATARQMADSGRVLDVLARAHLIQQRGPAHFDRHDRQVVTELATAVTRQWTAEAEMRALHRPRPVQLRWSSTGRPVAAAASAVLGHEPGTAKPKPLNFAGDLTDLVGKFRHLPERQLVVLGEPGAGKTVLAILLTLGLLNEPNLGEPVPVLLPVSSWNPQDEHLHSWLARKLIEEYPGLANTAAYGPQAAQRLVAEGRILPVLDGLDEVPPGLHAAAIDAVDQAIAGGRPLVVTCRSAEYEEAVLRGGIILATAAVVEIEPVDPGDAAAFLTARQPFGDTRWQPVVDHLCRCPAGPLATALSTALMVDLTRTAYSPPRSDPAELCDLARFPDRSSIEGHLLDAFLPAMYAQRHPPPAPAARQAAAPGFPPVAPRKYELAQAKQWLTCLARHLERRQSRDFAWWQLPHVIPRAVRGLLFGLPAALLFALCGEMAGGYRVAAVYGVSFALAGCIANAVGRRPGPLRVEIRFRGTAVRFLSRFGIGLAIGLGLGLAWSLPFGLIFVLVLVFGLALSVQVWLDIPADANRVSSPLTVLRQDRAAALAFTSSFALSVGTFYGVADAFAGKTQFILVFGGHFDLVLALGTGLAGTLLGRFAFGRLGGVVYGLAAAAAGGLVFPIAARPAAGFAAGTVFGLAVGVSIFMSRVWGSFVLSLPWLAIRGQVPLRLVRFLDDAHRRGVLRQAGAVYQFRHARLQDRLTEDLTR